MKLKFLKKNFLCSDIWQLHFQKPVSFNFEPGQYLELNLNLQHSDNRGTKRWFTISASPTEGDLVITTRLVKKHSEFKDDFFHLQSGDTVDATGPYGKFLLPAENQPILWIAGGIGATPFVSQMKFLIDQKVYKRNIVFIHGLKSLEENFCEQIVIDCQKLMPQFKYFSVLSADNVAKNYLGLRGYIDLATIDKAAPDHQSRQIYISGPEPMVDNLKAILVRAGNSEKNLHQDWFPGYKDKF